MRAWIAHPNTLLALQQIKIGTTYNLPLLGPDATSPTKLSILGYPAYWSPGVAADTVWLLTACSGAFRLNTGG